MKKELEISLPCKKKKEEMRRGGENTRFLPKW